VSAQLELGWDPQPGRDYTPADGREGAKVPTHAHTWDGCVFCDTRTGQEAKAAATKAVTRDEAWWEQSTAWLHRQPIGSRFTADDLVAAIGKPTGSTNQIGARLRSWAFGELIAARDVTEAQRKTSHGRLLRVWEVVA